ncbi:MAG: CopD family protein [Deltaproteobacteria bacterium]|nr:CopD family protein [Deltaproteobacteria bacterium]
MMMYPLAKTLHLFGVLLWVSGLFAVAAILAFRTREQDKGVQAKLGLLARRLALFGDAGSTLAILFGLNLLLTSRVLSMPWMHLKLTLVVALIGMHGWLRVKTKRAAQGVAVSLGIPAMAGLALAIFAILALAIFKYPLAS